MNRSTWKTPFEIVTGMKPRGVSNLRDILNEEKRSAKGEVFANYIHYLHREVKLKLEQSNQKHKENADKTRRYHIFEVGDR